MRLLLEVGTEDLPAAVIAGWPGRLAADFRRLAAARRLDGGRVSAFVTARRLVLLAEALPERQADLVSEISGPPVRVAFRPDGSPSPAGLGYCRAHGIAPTRLQTRQTDKGEQVYYLKKEKGGPARQLLPDLLGELLAGLPCPLPMRWGNGGHAFVRPVTSLLCLLDDRLLPLAFAGVRARRFTLGHPTLAPGRVKVTGIDDYFRSLAAAHVQLDRAARRETLARDVRAAMPPGCTHDQADLEAAVETLEKPAALKSPLALENVNFPDEAVALIIRKLRCLPLYTAAGRIAPEFFIVTDGRRSPEIEAGFRWVVGNRLEDARFFWSEDSRLEPGEHIARQEQAVFQAGVGTMGDYGRALAALAETLGARAGLDEPTRATLARAAGLAKMDLATSTVREFPELAGVAGAGLLAAAGEAEPVCRAVREHARPRFPGDAIPATAAGQILSLADKALALCGLFLAGAEPSGTSDPYGLRRLAGGLLETAWQGDLRLSAAETLAAAFGAWGRAGEARGEAGARAASFLGQRQENILGARGFRHDVVAAALGAAGDSLSAPPRRCAALQDCLADPEGPAALVTLSRVNNIVTQARQKELGAGVFRAENLREAAESALWKAWNGKAPAIDRALADEDFAGALALFRALGPAINLFFDQVLVMAPEETLRDNRLALLARLAATLARIGDISLIKVRARPNG